MRIYSVRRESAAKRFALTRRARPANRGVVGARPPSQDGEGGVAGLDTELDPDRDIPVKVLPNQTQDVFDAWHRIHKA
jgi:hypothetical protein